MSNIAKIGWLICLVGTALWFHGYFSTITFLGVKLTVFTIFTASLVGSIFGVGTILLVWVKRTRRFVRRPQITLGEARKRAWQSAQTMYRHYEMPFGVFLGSMAMVALFFGKQFLDWYWRLL